MVITVVDQDHIATVKSKGQPPVPIYLNGPVTCKLAFEWMKPPRGWFDIARTRSGIQHSKLKTQPRGMSRLDAGFRTGMEETLQPGVSKALNHVYSVSLHNTDFKRKITHARGLRAARFSFAPSHPDLSWSSYRARSADLRLRLLGRFAMKPEYHEGARSRGTF